MSWLNGFIAILYYEFLWNIRKKKIIGLFILVFVIVTLFLALPPILEYVNGATLAQNPNTVTGFFGGFSGIFLFLIAVATAMNTISGEFETGSITPLLTKPVSKNTVFVGKIVASVLTLIAIYAFLTVYVMVASLIIQGPQNNLQLAPLGLLGMTVATMVWASFVILLGTLSKSSLVSALGSFGVYIGLTIAGAILGSVFGQTEVLFYAPGPGATGSTFVCGRGEGATFATGTDNLGYLLIQLAINPNTILNYCGVRFRAGTQAGELFTASTGTIADAAFRALGISAAYVVILLLASWYAFRRSQIVESS